MSPACAVERRTVRKEDAGAIVSYGSLTIDRVRHVVVSDGSRGAADAKEFLLLAVFIKHRGRVLSRERLLTDVWGYQYAGGTAPVDVHVRRLRQKLPSLATALPTVHQFGYKLLDEGPGRTLPHRRARPADRAMWGGFRGRLLFASFGVAAVVLSVAAALVSTSIRHQTRDTIERGLVTQARLTAELLSHGVTAGIHGAALQDEARALEHDSGARVSFIAPDGRVLADSSQTEASLAGLENHFSRPEIVAARQQGIGIASRFSATLGVDMLYVAVPAPGHGDRLRPAGLAPPLTEVQQQLRAVWRSTLAALALSIAGALAIAWISSALLVRRLNSLAVTAGRYAAGELPASAPDYENDEIGTVARVLDDAVAGRESGGFGSAATRHGWPPSSPAWPRAFWWSMRMDVCSSSTPPPDGCCGSRRRSRDGTMSSGKCRPSRRDDTARCCPQRGGRAGRRRRSVEEGGRTFVARAAPVGGTCRSAPCSCCTTSPISSVPIASASDFVANVSHELRTPLTAIRGYVEALADEPVSREHRQAFLEIIARHTTRMERLAQDLLRLALL